MEVESEFVLPKFLFHLSISASGIGIGKSGCMDEAVNCTNASVICMNYGEKQVFPILIHTRKKMK